MAEAGVERADREALAELVLVADGLDGGTLDDEHVVIGLLMDCRAGYLEYSSTMSCSRTWVVDLLAKGQGEHADGVAAVLDLQPGRGSSVDRVEIVADHDELRVPCR